MNLEISKCLRKLTPALSIAKPIWNMYSEPPGGTEHILKPIKSAEETNAPKASEIQRTSASAKTWFL